MSKPRARTHSKIPSELARACISRARLNAPYVCITEKKNAFCAHVYAGVIDPTGIESRVDGRLRSSNSRNETSRQFRVIGKSGRCFRAIPWLVTAYHRVARQPTAPDTRAGSLPIEASRRVGPPIDLIATLLTSAHHPPAPRATSFSISLRAASRRPDGRLLEFHESRTIDNGSDHSFPVYSIRII